MFITPALAQTADAAAGNPIMQLLPLLLIFVVFYFLMIRPQQKRVKEHKAMVEAVRRGDVVVTAGGIVGKATKVHDDEVEVEIAPDTRVRVLKATLSDIRSKSEPVSKED